MLSFKSREDLRGQLIAIDAEFDLPFDIKRVFYIKNLDNLERGFHAHRKCIQVLVPIQGSFTLKLDNGFEKKDYQLNKANEGILVPVYNFLTMSNFSRDCIIMVLCSYKYDEAEYIRNYDEFLAIVKERAKSQTVKKILNFSLQKQTQNLKSKIMSQIENTIDNNKFVMGTDVIEFENKFRDYNGAKYCVAVSNGCAALKIAIKSLQLKNPKVLVQANTYVAVPLVCEELKIPYEIIDIDDNLLLDLNKLNKYLELSKYNDYEYIVIPVHLYGNCVNMHELLSLKEKYKLKIIEDAAQAHGSQYDNKKLGTFGDIGCFSFYPSKNLGAFGEAGAIITNNKNYSEYCKLYRNYGSIEKYNWKIIGGNERIDNIQGVVLRLKLDYLDKNNLKRSELASVYTNNINNKLIRILGCNLKCRSNYHLYIVLCEERDKLKQFLEDNNIMCAVHYPKPFYETDAYQHIKPRSLITINKFKNNVLSLPMYPELSKEDVLYVCQIINKFK